MDYALTAIKAYSHLNIFAAIVGILESGVVSAQNHTALKIIKLCQQEQQRLLEMYDDARAKSNEPTSASSNVTE